MRHPLQQRRLGLQRGHHRGLGRHGHPEGQGHRPDRRGDLRRRHAVADPEAGQPVGLGERPQHHHVGPLGDQVQPAYPLRIGDELDVRLVDHHQHVLGHRVQERHHVRVPQRRPGRVVRRAQQHHPGQGRDRRLHGREVVHRARTERHGHGRRAGDGHGDRVGLEAAPGVDHLVAGLAARLQQVVEHRHRPGAEGQPVRRHPEPLAQRRRHRDVAHVRVAVHLRHRPRRRLQHAGQRGIGVLVAGQLVGDQVPVDRGRWLARLVDRHPADGRPHPHCGHVRSGPRPAAC